LPAFQQSSPSRHEQQLFFMKISKNPFFDGAGACGRQLRFSGKRFQPALSRRRAAHFGFRAKCRMETVSTDGFINELRAFLFMGDVASVLEFQVFK
jgi:hypothetical protein